MEATTLQQAQRKRRGGAAGAAGAAKRQALAATPPPGSSDSLLDGRRLVKRNRKFEAHIWRGGKQVYLGSFCSASQAALAYDVAALRLRGQEAELNYAPAHYAAALEELMAAGEDEVVQAIRRQGSGKGAAAQSSPFRGVTRHAKVRRPCGAACRRGPFCRAGDIARRGHMPQNKAPSPPQAKMQGKWEARIGAVGGRRYLLSVFASLYALPARPACRSAAASDTYPPPPSRHRPCSYLGLHDTGEEDNMTTFLGGWSGG